MNLLSLFIFLFLFHFLFLSPFSSFENYIHFIIQIFPEFSAWHMTPWHFQNETSATNNNGDKKGRTAKSRFIVIVAASFIQLHQLDRGQRCHRHPVCITSSWFWPWATATVCCSRYHRLFSDINGIFYLKRRVLQANATFFIQTGKISNFIHKMCFLFLSLTLFCLCRFPPFRYVYHFIRFETSTTNKNQH